MTIRPGGPDIVPEQVVAGGQAEFGINWLDSLLATRDQGQTSSTSPRSSRGRG